MAQPKIEQALLKAGVIDDLQLRSARQHQAQWGGTITRAIAEKGFATEEVIVGALSTELGVARTELSLVRKDLAALAKIPLALAEEKAVFPVALRDNGKVLVVAMTDPSDLDLTDTLLRTARCRIKAQLAGDREIENAIRVHYKGEEPLPAKKTGMTAVVRADALELEPTSGEHTLDEMVERVSQPSRPSMPVAKPVAPPSDDFGLDALLGESREAAWSPEDLARLEQLRVNQEKGARVLQAIIDLCLQKGYLTPSELQHRLRR